MVNNEPEPVTDGPLPPPVAPHGLSLAFDHVYFTYPGKRQDTLRDLSSVSYTHLDVYKRQALQAANSAAAKTKVVAGRFMTSLVCRASAALVICSQRYGLLAD